MCKHNASSYQPFFALLIAFMDIIPFVGGNVNSKMSNK